MVDTHPTNFRASIIGAQRDLHPIVCEETIQIAREALTNAFRHAGAQHIEAEVSYGERALHVTIRDDGRGIDADVLHAGSSYGHFGLLGMRERAVKIRGQLAIWSKLNAGTEVELRVPASVAYKVSESVSHDTGWFDKVRSVLAWHKDRKPDGKDA
jgi:signal transduction histidine kinase